MSELPYDLLCVHCRYNLRGLDAGGRCPECGHAIEDSRRGDRLCFADRRWLRRLAWGARLALVGTLLSTLYIEYRVGNTSDVLIWAALRIPWMVLVGGLILVTSPDPRAASEPTLSPRQRTRWLGIALFLTVLFTDLATKLTAFHAWPPWWTEGVMMGAALWLWSLSDYAVQIGNRVPDPKLVREMRVAGRGLAGHLFLMAVLGIVATWLFTPNQGTGGFSINGRVYEPSVALGVILIPLMLVGAVCFLWMVMLAFRYGNRVTTAWNQARRAGPS